MKFWKKVVDVVAMSLGEIGLLNWGTIGISGFFGRQYNIVDAIFGVDTFFANAIYVLVGLSGVWLLWKSIEKWMKK